MAEENKDKMYKQTRLFAWLWLAVAVIGLVWLVSRVLNIDNMDPPLKKALLPGAMFVLGLIGAIQNKKILDRLAPDEKVDEEKEGESEENNLFFIYLYDTKILSVLSYGPEHKKLRGIFHGKHHCQQSR